MAASGLTKVLAVLGPVLLVGLGAYGMTGRVVGPGLVLLLAGLALAAGVAWTIPWSAVVDAGGVRVRMPAREVAVGWDDVVAFERHRAGRKADGGLVVRTMSGDKLAVRETAERPAEWDTLRELVSRYAPGVSPGTPPTGHPFLHVPDDA